MPLSLFTSAKKNRWESKTFLRLFFTSGWKKADNLTVVTLCYRKLVYSLRGRILLPFHLFCWKIKPEKICFFFSPLAVSYLHHLLFLYNMRNCCISKFSSLSTFSQNRIEAVIVYQTLATRLFGNSFSKYQWPVMNGCCYFMENTITSALFKKGKSKRKLWKFVSLFFLNK